MPTLFTGAPLDEMKKANLEEALGFFETMLKGRTWAAVNHFTIADLSLTITVSQIEAFGFDLTPYTRISTWLQRCKDFLAPHGYEVSIQNAITMGQGPWTTDYYFSMVSSLIAVSGGMRDGA